MTIITMITIAIIVNCDKSDSYIDTLNAHRQISKKWCSKKYCLCDKECQFSAL